jgi:hypothetical protein
METTNITITNIMRRKDRMLPLRAQEVSRYADVSTRSYTRKEKKQISCRSIADSLYIYAIVPLTHANPVGVSIGGVTILF